MQIKLNILTTFKGIFIRDLPMTPSKVEFVNDHFEGFINFMEF